MFSLCLYNTTQNRQRIIVFHGRGLTANAVTRMRNEQHFLRAVAVEINAQVLR
jgi:hypothetical protein